MFLLASIDTVGQVASAGNNTSTTITYKELGDGLNEWKFHYIIAHVKNMVRNHVVHGHSIPFRCRQSFCSYLLLLFWIRSNARTSRTSSSATSRTSCTTTSCWRPPPLATSASRSASRSRQTPSGTRTSTISSRRCRPSYTSSSSTRTSSRSIFYRQQLRHHHQRHQRHVQARSLRKQKRLIVDRHLRLMSHRPAAAKRHGATPTATCLRESLASRSRLPRATTTTTTALVAPLAMTLPKGASQQLYKQTNVVVVVVFFLLVYIIYI